MTKEGRYKLRVDLQAKNNSQWYWAEYQTFVVWDESTQYRLEIGGYNGNAGDSFTSHSLNGIGFSTRDRDNDKAAGSCSVGGCYNTGFWYNNCGHVLISSPDAGDWGFVWYDLPFGSGPKDRKLLVSRLTLLLN